MRDKDEILRDIRLDIIGDEHKRLAPLWVQSRLIEVLIDIRDALVTDCKDTLNALIAIRAGEKHEE